MGSNRHVSTIPGADLIHFLHWIDEDLAISNIARMRVFHNYLNHPFHHTVLDHDLQFRFVNVFDKIFDELMGSVFLPPSSTRSSRQMISIFT